MSKVVLVYFLVFFLYTYSLFAVVKGSQTSVSIESAATFPVADADNTMLGFGWFKNGFTLEDELTTCTFDSAYPVSGGVDLRGGTLHLLQDLIFKNTTDLQGWGNIVGNGHVLDFCTTITQLPSDASTFEDVTLFFSSDLKVTSTITCKGSCVFCGMGNELIMQEGGALVVDSNATLQLRDMEIIGVADKNIQCTDDSSCIILDNVRWFQDDHTIFDAGSIAFRDQVSFLGSFTFTYESSQTSTIASHAQWTITDDMHLCIGRDQQSGNEPLAFTDESSMLKLDNCSLIITSSGMQFAKGTVVFDRNVTADMQSTSTDTGAIIGTGAAQDDCIVYYSPGSVATFNSGHFTYNNSTNDKIQSSSKTARFVRTEGSNVYVAQDLELPAITIELTSNSVPPMQVNSGKTLSYNNSGVVLPDIEFDITSNQFDAYTYLLNGNDSLFFSKGFMPLATLVLGTGNKIQGNGSISGPIVLQGSSPELSLGITGDLTSAITLSSGKVSLTRDLLLSGNGIAQGPGTIDLSTHSIELPSKSVSWNTPTYWMGNDGKIGIHGKLSLSETWTLQGDCTINGNANTLDLSNGGELVVGEGSHLILKNMRVLGVSDQNIQCLDDDGSLTLINVEWAQDSTYTFSLGSMKFIRRNMMSGPYTFAYESSQTSTIQNDSRLIINDGMKFSIGRKEIDSSVEPLYFDDSSAELKFDNAIFSVKSTGMRLTRGAIITSRDVEVEVNSTSTANGLTFGDGTVDNDMQFLLHPGVSARFTKGHLTYDITANDGIKSKSNTARLIRLADSVFYLKHNLDLADIMVDVNPLSSLIIDDGILLTYTDGRIVLAQGMFDLTGTRYNDYTSLLAGNDEITLVNGSLPLLTLVQGTGNTIEGSGNVAGTVTLQDDQAELSLGINGYLAKNITMNGGKIILNNDLSCANDVLFIGSGIIDLSDNNINLGKSDLSWTGTTKWMGTNASVNFNSQVSLSGTWTFNGTCVLKGNGNILDLGTTGEIIVDNGSALYLENLILENVSNNNVRCLNGDSHLMLDNVQWVQDADYTFIAGKMTFKNKVKMHGANKTFAYQSDQISTIAAESQLKLDVGFTFSYDPIIIASKDLFTFAEDTSQLLLDSATLHTTVTGMNLTKGKVLVRGESALSSELEEKEEDVFIDEGITLGDGTANNDCMCTIAGGALLKLVQGTLVYNNVSSNAWIMENNLSVVHLPATTKLVLQNSLNLGAGRLQMSEKTLIERSAGKEITGSIFVID